MVSRPAGGVLRKRASSGGELEEKPGACGGQRR
jgi:hypothetical protein